MNFFFIVLFKNMALSSVGNLVGKNGTITNSAMMILAAVFLVSVYEAFVSGGSMRSLFVAMLKTAACGLLIENWGGANGVFMNVSDAFTSLASSIISAGGHSMAQDFIQQFGQNLNQNYTTTWQVVKGVLSGQAIPDAVAAALGLVVLIVYYVAMVILEFIYCAWGMILMCLGPLMVALLPSRVTSGFAKEWIKGFFEWASWPVLYAILAILALNCAMNANTVSQFLDDVGLKPATAATGAITASIENDILALLYCVMMIILPFLASALMKGSFNGVYMAMQKIESMVKNAAALATGNFGAAAANAAAAGASKSEAGAWDAIGASAAAGNPVMASAPPATPSAGS